MAIDKKKIIVLDFYNYYFSTTNIKLRTWIDFPKV